MGKKNRSKKGITIVSRKVLVQGEKKHQITHVNALQAKDLPKRYLDGLPYVYLNPCLHGQRVLVIMSSEAQTGLVQGYLYHGKDYQLALNICLAAGVRLKQINEELAAENKDWHGVKTITF